MKVVGILMAVGLLTAAALAQGPSELYAPAAPRAPALSAATPWAAIAISLLGAVGICVAGFKSSHRTHLD